jgi:hypothetical protein
MTQDEWGSIRQRLPPVPSSNGREQKEFKDELVVAAGFLKIYAIFAKL